MSGTPTGGAPDAGQPADPGPGHSPCPVDLVSAVAAAARRWPAATAVVEVPTGRSETHRSLAGLVARRAAEVTDVLPPADGGGLRPVVAVEHGSPEGVDLLVDLLAVAAAGAVALVRNPTQPPAPWQRQCRAAGPVVALRPEGPRRVDPGPGTRDLSPDTYQLVATSGSTGTPKLVQLTQPGTLAAAAVYRRRVAVRPGEAVAVPQSLATVGALPSGVLPALLSGGTAVLGHGWGVRTFLDTLTGHRAVFAMAVTGWWQACLAAPWPALPALRVLGVGGSPWHHLLSDLRRRLPHAEVLGNYGLTETHGPALQASTGEVADVTGIAGRPVPGLEAEVRDDAGAAMAPGERGMLWLRGSLVTPGYARRGAAGEDDRDGAGRDGAGRDGAGWWCTGDVAVRGPDGWFRVVDRADDLVNVAGRKVYPAEVEAVLRGVPGVVDCAVVRSDSPVEQRLLGAFVVTGGTGFNRAAARRAVREQVGSHALPARLDVVSELPRTGSGKVDREALRRRLSAPAAR